VHRSVLVDASDPAVPASLAFSQLSPNPTHGEATIAFVLPTPTRVRVTIFDIQGRLVARPLDAMRPAGRNEVRWSESVAPSSGVYVVRIDAGGRSVSRRLIVVR
jgi:hypothetical protein